MFKDLREQLLELEGIIYHCEDGPITLTKNELQLLVHGLLDVMERVTQLSTE